MLPMNPRLFAFATAGVILVVCIAPPAAEATHFRYSHVTWTPVAGSPLTAEFVLTSAFRRDGFSGTAQDGLVAVGDIFTEEIGATNFGFGDGEFTPTLRYRATAIDAASNFVIGRALSPGTTTENLIHAYPAATNGGLPWIAAIDSGNRISTLRNCAECFYRVETAVRFDIANSSPVSGLPVIVNVPIDTAFSFPVPAIDGDGDLLTWRLSTAGESRIEDPIGPDGTPDAVNAPSIDPSTGVVSWDTTGGTAVGDLFCMQVTIEESRGGGLLENPEDGESSPRSRFAVVGGSNTIGKSAVDFILRVVPQGDPPTCTITPPGPFNISTGRLLTFNVAGGVAPAPVFRGDPNGLTLNTGGLPPGATMTPGLPVSGPAAGVTSVFNWTPALGQEGVYSVIYTVTQDGGLQSFCNALITVCRDGDGDSACDESDACPDTPAGEVIDGVGCSCSQRDSDSDGVNDCIDLCAGTPTGSSVNSAGCIAPPVEQGDPNGPFAIPGCDPRGWVLDLLLSLLFRAPVCGIGCPAAVLGTLSGLAVMRLRRRR